MAFFTHTMGIMIPESKWIVQLNATADLYIDEQFNQKYTVNRLPWASR